MIDANKFIIFHMVVKTGSFTQAANKLNVSKSFVSTNITQLEKKFNAKLMQRTTRALHVTQFGEKVFSYAEKLVNTVDEAYDLGQLQKDKGLSGNIKIAIMPAWGLDVFSTMITNFLDQNPKVSVEMSLSSSYVDMISGGYDLIIRSGSQLEDSSFIAKNLPVLSQYFVLLRITLKLINQKILKIIISFC